MHKILITGSFIIEPLRDTLSFWVQEIPLRCEIKFSPYNHLFQTLMGHKGQNEAMVLLIRDKDLFHEAHEQNFHLFIQYLQSACKSSSSSFFVIHCPDRIPSLWGEYLKQEIRSIPGAYYIELKEWLDKYQVDIFFDSKSENSSHIPYTPSVYTVLGTLIARIIYTLQSPVIKLVGVDCDNTLWQGVVAEEGIIVHKEFQHWLLDLHKKGIALALFSKNESADVEAVFENNSDMILNKDCITAWYVNWINKAENLSHLIHTLNIGSDSVLFLDDNPIECAAISAYIPETVVVQFTPLVFDHIWDIPIYFKGTREDSERPAMYKQHLIRECLKQTSRSFSEFIASLDLRVRINLIEPIEFERVSQLTQRTNQFNASNYRRKSQQIQEFLEDKSKSVHVIHAEDRFGNYGLVGAIFLEENENALIVDTLLLSCRVLGRGIEYQMISFVGKFAHGKPVIVNYKETKRNTPMKKFLEALNPLIFEGGAYHFSSETLARATFKPDESQAFEPLVPDIKTIQTTTFNRTDFAKLTTNLYTAESIRRRIRKTGPFKSDESIHGLESLVVRSMSDVLNMDGISVKDHFFSTLGGDSFDAAMLASRLQEVTHKAVDITHVFDHPTAEALSLVILQLPRISNQEINSDFIHIPATVEQLAIWYGMHAANEPSQYQIPLVYHIEGNLEVKRLESALEILKKRYDILQTSFKFLENDYIHINEAYYSHQLELISPGIWKLEVIFHHIICDEQSIAIFMQDLSALYNRPDQELSPAGSYAQYSLNQERHTPSATIAFWKHHLPISTPPMSPVRTAGNYSLSIPSDLREKALNICGAHEVTPFIFFLSLFSVGMRYFTQTHQFLVGTPFSTRQSDKIFGLFMHLLPINFSFEGEMNFDAILQSTKKQVSEISKHRFTPFYRIQEELGTAIHLNTVFSWNRRMGQTPSFQGLKTTRLDVLPSFSEFDLSFIVEEDEGTYRINIQYASSVYENWQIQVLGKNFINLLKKITHQPHQPINSLLPSLKSDNTKDDRKERKSLIEMIESIDPSSIAIENDNTSLTYQSLNEKSNQLAYSLLQRGLGINKGAAICLENPIEQIIASLAVLKTGGFFIPLDHKAPQKHHKAIIEDVQPFLVIDQISDDHIKSFPESNLHISISSTDIAYVIYTSGSTGKPKGVIIEHAGLSHRAMHAKHLFHLSPHSRVLCQASPTFDMHIAEWAFALACGATVCPYKGEIHRLWDFIVTLKVSHAILTPGVLSIFPSAPSGSLKYVMVAGEVTPQKIMEMWSKHTTLFNGYGPAECSIFTHIHCFKSKQSARIIGRSVFGVECSVVDDQGKVVPEGGIGELYIEGIGVTRGYVGMEPLAHRQFKTGDLVRVLPDGWLEYVGRKDHLVKVNGCRVDIHMIENKILSIPNISEAAVVPTQSEEHNSLLACFFSGNIENVKIIKRELRKQLPLYMVPSQYFHLETLPRLLNGKIDREKLVSERLDNHFPSTHKLSDLETSLGIIWERILGKNPLNGEADFFQMGGDSLKTVQLIIEIEKSWGIEIFTPELLDNSSLEDLAQIIASRKTTTKRQTIIPIQTKGSRTPLFLVHPSTGLAECYRPLSKHLQDQPIYGIQNPFISQRASCFSSVFEMARHYSYEIKQTCPVGPFIIGGWSFGGVVALEIADILTTAGNLVDRVILFDSYAPDMDVEEFSLEKTSEDLIEESKHNAKLLKNHPPSCYRGIVQLIRALDSRLEANGWKTLPHLFVQDIYIKHHEMFDIQHIPQLADSIEILFEKAYESVQR